METTGKKQKTKKPTIKNQKNLKTKQNFEARRQNWGRKV
jgi:hypothetical protein